MQDLPGHERQEDLKMAQVSPFKGLVYNQDKLISPRDVVAPPYDVISKEEQDELYRRHPHNIVRLILGKIEKGDGLKNNRYTRAGAYFEKWLKEKALFQDEKKAIYVYSQIYNDGSKPVERVGFIGLMKLNKGRGRKRDVLAHENTLASPKLDRLNLIRSVKANLSPIFVLYDDASHSIVKILKRFCAKETPFLDMDYDNVTHTVWRLDDPRVIKRIEGLMRHKDIFIADGHHRYEAACTYSAEVAGRRAPAALKKNSKYLMAYFVETDERMLTILASHRVVRDIGALVKDEIKKRLLKYFQIEKARDVKSVIAKLRDSADSPIFGMYMGGEFSTARMKSVKFSDSIIKNSSREWKRLDVTILHLFILEYALGIRDDDDNVEFVKDAKEAVRLVESGRFKLAFFLNPTKVSEVKQIARLGERMPRKATYFYPKPLSGLVINKL